MSDIRAVEIRHCRVATARMCSCQSYEEFLVQGNPIHRLARGPDSEVRPITHVYSDGPHDSQALPGGELRYREVAVSVDAKTSVLGGLYVQFIYIAGSIIDDLDISGTLGSVVVTGVQVRKTH